MLFLEMVLMQQISYILEYTLYFTLLSAYVRAAQTGCYVLLHNCFLTSRYLFIYFFFFNCILFILAERYNLAHGQFSLYTSYPNSIMIIFKYTRRVEQRHSDYKVIIIQLPP